MMHFLSFCQPTLAGELHLKHTIYVQICAERSLLLLEQSADWRRGNVHNQLYKITYVILKNIIHYHFSSLLSSSVKLIVYCNFFNG